MFDGIFPCLIGLSKAGEFFVVCILISSQLVPVDPGQGIHKLQAVTECEIPININHLKPLENVICFHHLPGKVFETCHKSLFDRDQIIACLFEKG